MKPVIALSHDEIKLLIGIAHVYGLKRYQFQQTNDLMAKVETVMAEHDFDVEVVE